MSSKKRRAIACSWDLLTSYVRALTQTYVKVAKFQSVFSRVVQRGVPEVTRPHNDQKTSLVGISQ